MPSLGRLWQRLQQYSPIRRMLPTIKAPSPDISGQKTVRHVVSNIRRRAKAIRRLIKHVTNMQERSQDEPTAEDPSLPLWDSVATPLSL